MTAMPTVETTAGTSSRELCRRALAVYCELAARFPYSDEPDLGLEIHLSSGRKSLEMRAESRSWIVTPRIAEAAEAVLASAPPCDPCEPLIEWLETFPRTFLTVIDRRQLPTIPMQGGRRAWDRLVQDTLIRSSGPR